MFRIEHNVETGEITQIKLTPEEIAEIEANAVANAYIEFDKKAAKAAVLAKLNLTADEVAALLG